MGRNSYGQEVPEPEVHDGKIQSQTESGLLDHLGRKLVRKRIVGFKRECDIELEDDQHE